MPLLDIKNLSAGYGPINVLDGIALHVDKGEIVAMIGANGAGKTTTLMALSGVVQPRGTSSIEFDGQPIAGQPAPRHRQAWAGAVARRPQDFPEAVGP